MARLLPISLMKRQHHDIVRFLKVALKGDFLTFLRAQSKAQQILSKIEEQSEKQFLPIIGQKRGAVLKQVIREHKPKRVLEIGTLIGYSAILIAKELPPEAELVSIEIHEDEAKIARLNIQTAEVSPKVQVLTGDAKKVLPKLSGTFDMVFIDAEKTEYLQYLKLAEHKLHKGSVILADNAGVFADQMKDFLDYVRNSGKYESRYFGFENDGVEVSVKL